MDIKRILPEPVTGYQIDLGTRGFFSVIVPESTTNLCTNPSFEKDTTGWTSTYCTFTRSSEIGKFGKFSAKIVATSTSQPGIYFKKTCSAGTSYTFSLYVFIAYGKKVALKVYNWAGGQTTGYKEFYGNGGWKRIWLTVSTPTSATYAFQVIAKENSLVTYYVDGVQIEAKGYPTTYCDGDMTGFVLGETAYKWDGASHASTSTRSETTKSGGQEVYLNDIGFVLKGLSGLGVNTVENIATPVTNGGDFYQKTVQRSRRFSIIGSIYGKNINKLLKVRGDIEEAFGIGDTVVNQPTLLMFHRYLEDGQEVIYKIPCFYESGLELGLDNNYQENITLNFIQLAPYDKITSDGVTSKLVNVYGSSTIATGNMFSVDRNDVMTPLFTSITGIPTDWNFRIEKMIIDTDGTKYFIPVMGALPSVTINGVAVTGMFALDTSGVVHPITVPANTTVKWMALHPNGNIYVVASSSTAGLSGIYTLNKSTFSIGAAPTWVVSTFYSSDQPLVFDNSGNMYLFGIGATETIAGVTVHYSARYNISESKWYDLTPSAFTPFPGGLIPLEFNDAKYDVLSNSIILVGNFIKANNVSAKNIARYSISTGLWSAIDYGLGQDSYSESVYSVTIAPNGYIYAFGEFGFIRNNLNLPCGGAAYFNGSVWNSLAYQVGNSTTSGFAGFYTSVYGRGEVWGGGGFDRINNKNVPCSLIKFIGTNYRPFNLLTGTRMGAVAYDVNTDLFYVYVPPINAYQNMMTIGNTGSHTYPTISCSGGGFINAIVNYTTGEMVKFDNIPVGVNEQVTLDFSMGYPVIVSSIYGDISRYVSPGSSPTITLAKGNNIVGVLFSPNLLQIGGATFIGDINLYGINLTNCPDNILYCTKVESLGHMTVSFYKDSARTQKVASTSTDVGWYPGDIISFGGSGITGTCWIKFVTGTENFEIRIMTSYISFITTHESINKGSL